MQPGLLLIRALRPELHERAAAYAEEEAKLRAQAKL
jgi:hypothetical protein